MSTLVKTFADWFSQPETRLLLPVLLTGGSESTDFEIRTRNAALPGRVDGSELTVSAEWNGIPWDLLLSLDVLPSSSQNKTYTCELCEGQSRREFLTIDALWRDRLFDPFALWIAEKLHPAAVLAFYQTDDGGATWARLHTADESTRAASHVLRL